MLADIGVIIRVINQGAGPWPDFICAAKTRRVLSRQAKIFITSLWFPKLATCSSSSFWGIAERLAILNNQSRAAALLLSRKAGYACEDVERVGICDIAGPAHKLIGAHENQPCAITRPAITAGVAYDC
jgi:hypothetical protein